LFLDGPGRREAAGGFWSAGSERRVVCRPVIPLGIFITNHCAGDVDEQCRIDYGDHHDAYCGRLHWLRERARTGNQVSADYTWDTWWPGTNQRSSSVFQRSHLNGTNYLIDAGDGVVRTLAQVGINVRQVGKVFITHDHDDHTAGLGTLLSYEWDFQRHDPVDVYGPPGTAALVKGAIQYFTVNAEIRWHQASFDQERNVAKHDARSASGVHEAFDRGSI